MNSKVFNGANVFMSRNLVPPELFDSLHDALKLNGAQLFLCCDPSRNAPNDYHIISSPDHEKFEDLKSKGCNLLGPHCVLTCAKERRPLANQGFTCCLAMDGVKVLASGFEMDEKVEIGKLVTAMGGVLHTKASADVSFVIVKNVLAAKYKWALNVLRKPIVTKNWLHQCWKEHRIVPEESYKVLPFSGLTICVSRIPAEERKVMEKLIMQNGGKYSAELTKKCTHLVCDAPEGDKYKVAKRWGHTHIVTRKWYDQSLARRACLNEESYHVQCSSTSVNTVRAKVQHSQDNGVGISRCELSTSAMTSTSQLCARTADQDLEVAVSQNVSSAISDVPVCSKDVESGQTSVQQKNDPTFGGSVAYDSQTEDNDLYLSDCRLLLVGFEASEMRKLVNMVRRGGGSRYMSFNDKLTHIIVGSPSEIEIKEARSLAAMGIIHLVKADWLEDCDREKKESSVHQGHIAYDLLLPKDHSCAYKRTSVSINSTREGKSSAIQSTLVDDLARGNVDSKIEVSPETIKEQEIPVYMEHSVKTTGHINQPKLCSFDGKGDMKVQNGTCVEIEDRKSSTVFKGRLFCFSPSFPVDRRVEIIQWVNQGGGQIVRDHTDTYAHFTIECHGVVPLRADAAMGAYVSSHWVRSCLEDGCLLDVGSHILYSPLPCQIPFVGFEGFRICVSQYDEKERQLLRNLCFVLGTKFAEKLTKRVTHLLCKFTSGPKFEAACKWGIQPVTAEWIYECINQNKVIAPGLFHPKEVTAQDHEAGLCTTSQYPTQAVRMISGDNASQLLTQSQEFKNFHTEAPSKKTTTREETMHPINCKKPRLLEVDNPKHVLSSESIQNNHPICRMPPSDITESVKERTIVPDVAAAIEDLLEQTSKINDQKSPERSECDKSLFASECTILCQDQGDPCSAFGLSKQWTNRFDKKDDNPNPSRDVAATVYDSFSETQTESQVVGYAEDLSGRQMIIDRVRTRSSMT